jgi:flagellin-like protein
MTSKRRGVSPVIATLLLIVIAVAAAVLTYIWVTGYMGTLQAQAGAQQVQERIKIEGVQVNNNQISAIYVRNIGDTKVKIADVYLLDSSGNVIDKASPSTTLDPASSTTISGELPTTTLQSGKTYIVKVVTERGTEATYQFTYRP